MELRLENGLPIIAFSLTYQERTINISNVLFDTGCTSTILTVLRKVCIAKPPNKRTPPRVSFIYLTPPHPTYSNVTN